MGLRFCPRPKIRTSLRRIDDNGCNPVLGPSHPESFDRRPQSKVTMTEPPLKTAALPQVGQTAPDFELPDSTRAMRRLSELTAYGPLVLLFYRGHW